MTEPSARHIRFGDFTLDREAGTLLDGNGGPVELRGKPLDLLERLLLRATNGPETVADRSVVSYAELARSVWPERAPQLEEDPLACHNLMAHAVRRIRAAIGEDTIENLPRRGYRYAGPLPVELNPDSATPNRRLAWGLVLILAAVAAVWLARTLRPPNPISFEISGDQIRVLDEDAEVAFNVPIPDWNDSSRERPFSLVGRNVAVHDLDGDGRNEVIVTHVNGPTGPARCEVYDERGRLIHRIALHSSVTVGQREFGYFYPLVSAIATWDGRQYVALVSRANWYPTFLYVIEAGSDEPLIEYGHPGHIYWLHPEIVEIRSRPCLLVGGANNPEDGLGHAFLAAVPIDSNTVDSNRTTPLGFPDLPALSYLLFPRLDLSVAGSDVPAVTRILPLENGWEVWVAGAVAYTLDDDLQLLAVRPGDEGVRRHDAMFRDGRLDHTWNREDELAACRVLRFDYTPDGNDPTLPGQFARVESPCNGG